MVFSDEAVQRLLEYKGQNKFREEVGVRITAEEVDNQVSYEVYWEEKERPKDMITYHDGIKFFIDQKSKELVKDTFVYLIEKNGQEGLFIMKNTSNCSSCSTTCF